jgi:hypothetical protein
MPTNSEIEFELNGTYRTFSTLVGLDDEFKDQKARAEFVILGDGKELWKSEALKKSDGAKLVTIELANIHRLTLRVRREGEGGRVHADWVDAKLVK